MRRSGSYGRRCRLSRICDKGLALAIRSLNAPSPHPHSLQRPCSSNTPWTDDTMAAIQSTHEVWSGTVRRLEKGFFVERDQFPGPGELDFSKRVVDGIGSTTQFFRVRVDDHGVPDSCEEIWMVCTAIPTGNRPPSPDLEPLQ